MNDLARSLLAACPGVPVAVDDPTLLDRWTGGRDPEQILLDVLADVPYADLPAVFAVMERPDFAGALVCSDQHPCLAEVAAFVRRSDPPLVLVASRSGPPPPAVLVMERDR